MKLFKDYKKQYLKVLLSVVIVFVLPILFSYAQTALEIQNKISEKNSDIERIEQEIKKYQQELSGISKQKSTLSSLIKELDLTRKKLVADISLTEKKIDRTNLSIQSLSSDINNKESSISNNQRALIIDVKNMYELEESDLTEMLLKRDNLTDIWQDVDHMATIREAIISKIITLRKVKGDLEVKRTDTVSAKNELIALRSKLADQKKIVEQNTTEKNKLLKETKNNESTYQKLVKEQTAKKAALEEELRNYESQLKFILDPSALPNAGVLSWPLDDVYVTQLFGKTVAAKRLYASGSHSGVDFRASVGTPVKAMADGTVLGVGDTDTTCPGASFGKWVFIEYTNGLSSTYGHLSLNKAYVGQKVSRGEIVGYSGSTGRVTGPHLHVTVYASSSAKVQTLPSKSCAGKTLTQPIAATGAYLDPMYYLPPYKQ